MKASKEDKRLERLARAERAIDDALYNTGRVDRSEITRKAQEDAEKAVTVVGTAMEADEIADDARRILLIAEYNGDQNRVKAARKRDRAARRKAREEHRIATKSAKRAYEAIKFSDPNKMGLMRVVQVGFVFHIAWTLLMLLLASRDTYAYNPIDMVRWILVIFEGMAFWMFIHRFKVARPLVIGLSAFAIIFYIISSLLSHTFSPSGLLEATFFYQFVLFYFLTSDRVKATLVNDISSIRADRGEDVYIIERHGWSFARNLVIYFIVFSILGHWMEMAMCQLIRLKLVQGEYDPTNTMLWRDWLYPFPMEGTAVVIIALVLYPLFTWLKRKLDNKVLPYVISFLANALTCSIIEFSMGLMVNADYSLWDYRENFGNIMGQVCLQNAMAFGVACSVIAWFVYPSLERWIARVPRDIMNIAFAATVMFGCIIWSLYLVEIPLFDDLSEPVQMEASDGSQGSDVSPTPGGDTEISQMIDQMEQQATQLHTQLEQDESLTDEQRDELSRELTEIMEDIIYMQLVMQPE